MLEEPRTLAITDPDALAGDGQGAQATPQLVPLSKRLTVAMTWVNVPALMALGLMANPLADAVVRDADGGIQPPTAEGEEPQEIIRAEPELDPTTGEPRRDPEDNSIIYKPLTTAQRLHNMRVREKTLRWQDSIFKELFAAPPYADLTEVQENGNRRPAGKLWIGMMADAEIRAAMDAVYGGLPEYESFRAERAGDSVGADGAGPGDPAQSALLPGAGPAALDPAPGPTTLAPAPAPSGPYAGPGAEPAPAGSRLRRAAAS